MPGFLLCFPGTQRKPHNHTTYSSCFVTFSLTKSCKFNWPIFEVLYIRCVIFAFIATTTTKKWIFNIQIVNCLVSSFWIFSFGLKEKNRCVVFFYFSSLLLHINLKNEQFERKQFTFKLNLVFSSFIFLRYNGNEYWKKNKEKVLILHCTWNAKLWFVFN